MSKQKALKAIAGAFVIGISSTLPLNIGNVNENNESTVAMPYEYRSSVASLHMPYQGEYNEVMYIDTSSLHINRDEMEILINSSNTHDSNVDQYIVLLQLDKEDDESFESSRFIDKQYSLNDNDCVKMIQKAFRTNSYKFAKDVISSIRFSDINYLQIWFKELLLEGRRQPKFADYFNDLLGLYREDLEVL